MLLRVYLLEFVKGANQLTSNMKAA